MKNKMSYKESIRRQNYRDMRNEVYWSKQAKLETKRASFEKYNFTDEDIVNFD